VDAYRASFAAMRQAVMILLIPGWE